MLATLPSTTTDRYAKCIETSRRIRWDIDRDVIRGRVLDASRKFLPDGLSMVSAVPGLDPIARLLFSQVQGRTYANMFGLVERYIGAKVLDVSRDHALGDQVAMEALVRFAEEELKHQELFRRVERLASAAMPPGYTFLPEPNAVAEAVLGKSTWSVLALTCMIELFTQEHYRQSIDPDPGLSPLWKDVFLFHWKEESQHAILDELEWLREDARLTAPDRDAAVDDFISLAGAVDGLLQMQAGADAAYFASVAGGNTATMQVAFLKAYRWQYILSGAGNERFQAILGKLVTPPQAARIGKALEPLM